MRKFCICASLVLPVLAWGAGAPPHDYPVRPIRVIVPVGPGGGLDFVARLLAPKLSENFGQTVVIDNRAGASGNIGVELAAQAAPDGYTLLFLSMSSVISAVMVTPRFDLQRDFLPVSQATAATTVLIAYPGIPAKSVAEFVAYAKANPGRLNYSSTGNGTLLHLAGVMLGQAAGIEVVHVPYKAVATSMVDLLAGQIQFSFTLLVNALPHAKAGRLRMLAVTGARRSRAAPDLPTVTEAGVPGFVITQWHAMLAPSNTPRPIVERMHREIVAVLRQPAIAARLEEGNIDTIAGSPQQLAAQLKADHLEWAAVIRRAGLRLE